MSHQAALDIANMKIATNAELLNLKFIRTAALAGSSKRVILRVSKIIDVCGVGAKFGSEIFCVERRILGAAVAIEPGPIGVCKRLGLFGLFSTCC